MAKKKAKKARFLVFPDGEIREITGETGKYWLCGETQFRKTRGLPVCEKNAEENAETANGEEGRDE